MNLVESVRNFFMPKVDEEYYKDLAEEMGARDSRRESGILLLSDREDDYEPLSESPYLVIASDDDFPPGWGSYSTSGSHYLPMIACTTAMESSYPFQPVTELKYEPLAEWVCKWCGNMWPSNIQSCEKCGGPKGETND